MRHRDDPAFAPLQQCQTLAARLRRELAAPGSAAAHPEHVELAAGRHPLAYLVEFTAEQANLADSRWELLHEAVSEAFGRPLAVAAARGKLWLSTDIPGLTHGADGGAMPLSNDEDAWPTATFPRLSEVIAEKDNVDADADTLIWQALQHNRPSAAFLVASYAGEATRVPLWLLRALCLSPYLAQLNGDIALQLTNDFAQCDPGELGSAPGQHDRTGLALRLLIVAAALRPSLLAPDTGAWAILRAHASAPELPNLERYVQVVGAYGERHPPLARHTFAAADGRRVARCA
jgi:hypothetical protein